MLCRTHQKFVMHIGIYYEKCFADTINSTSRENQRYKKKALENTEGQKLKGNP